MTALLAGKWLVFSLAVAATSGAFVELTHALRHQLEKRVPSLPLRMALGGAVVVVLWRAIGTSGYVGLGVPTIVRAFVEPNVPAYAFAAKLVSTGARVMSHVFLVAVVASLLTGYRGIYPSQRLTRRKGGRGPLPGTIALRDVRTVSASDDDGPSSPALTWSATDREGGAGRRG
jgi:hypothetical protein